MIITPRIPNTLREDRTQSVADGPVGTPTFAVGTYGDLFPDLNPLNFANRPPATSSPFPTHNRAQVLGNSNFAELSHPDFIQHCVGCFFPPTHPVFVTIQTALRINGNEVSQSLLAMCTMSLVAMCAMSLLAMCAMSLIAMCAMSHLTMCAMSLHQNTILIRHLDHLHTTVNTLTKNMESLQKESSRIATVVTQCPTQPSNPPGNNPPAQKSSYADAAKSPATDPPSKKRNGKGGNSALPAAPDPNKNKLEKETDTHTPHHKSSLPQRGDSTPPEPPQP